MCLAGGALRRHRARFAKSPATTFQVFRGISAMKTIAVGAFAFFIGAVVQTASAQPTVGSTTVLGPFAGVGATLNPSNIQFYGTDLGLTYTQGGNIQVLFGDSWRNEANQPIGNPSPPSPARAGDNDDAFGSIDLGVYPSPGQFSPTFLPVIRLAVDPGTAFAAGTKPARPMDIGKTPLGGFSNGSREFAWFATTKPLACSNTADCNAATPGLTCDTGLGYWNAAPSDQRGVTLGCLDSQFGCIANTKSGTSGFCRDTTSTIYANTASGRLAAVAAKLVVGVRSTSDARSYTNTIEVVSSKFLNSTVATVQSFIPTNGAGYLNQDYSIASGSGAQRRVLLWGRPAFIGVNAKGRTDGLYFAYVDMPTSSQSSNSFAWTIRYYTGMSGNIPQFSTSQADAVAVDLNSTAAGVQTNETHDVVNQMSVMWVAPLHKWVMFYGGGMSKLPTFVFPNCGVLQLFAGPDCSSVSLGNGAIRMRTADDPWGPWTPPQDVIVGGVPSATPLQGQYAPGGVLRHPNCTAASCAPHSNASAYQSGEYGFLYGANLIQAWTTQVGSSVDVVWNVSTWDPYRVVLLRTRINP